jgi:hypothetical protein
MKKEYFLLLLIAIYGNYSFSQNKLSFIDDSKSSKYSMSRSFKNFKILKLVGGMDQISNGEWVNINYGQGYSYVLKENKLLSDHYVLSLKGSNGVQRKSIQETGFDGKYFFNEDISENNQFVFSTFENTFSIFIKKGDSEFYIEPLKKYDSNALENEYVYYLAKDAVVENYGCGIKEDDTNKNSISNQNNKAAAGGCKTLELAMSVDYTVYNSYGSVNALINRTLEVLNLTQANFTIINGLAEEIHFTVNEHYIVTCDGNCNYWLPTLTIMDNYNSFGINASKMFVYPYDIKVHWQNQGGPGNVIGLGSYVMCGTNGIVVIKNYASNTNYTRCILSHEIGHNLGCVHDSEIMNATISSSNIWSGASITTINKALNTLTCLTACEITACDNKKVNDLVTTVDAINNKINVNWTSESGITYQVRLYNYNSNTWSAYTTFNYPNNTTSFDYTPIHCNDKYKVEIVPFCSGSKGISAQVVVETNENVPAPSLSFSSNTQNNPICNGRFQTFSVSSVDGGTNPIYQWKLNNNPVGTNSNTFNALSGTLNNNDILSCELTSNASCVSSTFASVSKVLTVIPATLLSVLLSASQTTICGGNSITLTATGTNIEGLNPYYAWQLNGQPYNAGGQGDPGGQSGPIITVIPLNNGDVYSCVLYDGTGCHSSEGATSNDVTITVQNPCTLSVDDFVTSDFRIFPNPADDVLTVSSRNIISTLSIYDILGQELIKSKIDANKSTIDISFLSKGTYFMKIVSKEVSKTIKIIKN